MCGLFAILSMKSGVNTWNTKLNDVIKEGIYVTALRGEDSTGVFTVHETKPKEVYYLKNALSPAQYLETKGYTRYSTKHFSSARFIVAHTRYATKGDICYDNAHPFNVAPITMVHNGVVRNTHDFKDVNYDVDSNYIAHYLSKDNDVKTTLARLQGAFALIWYNSEEESLNIVRNNERSLFYYFDASSDRMFISSEREMLYMILRRNMINADLDKILSFEENTWYKYVVGEKVVEEHRTSISFKENKSITNSYNYHGYMGAGGGWPAHTSKYHKASENVAWANAPRRFPIYSGDRLILTDLSFIPNSDGGTGTVYGQTSVAYAGKNEEVAVTINGVHERFMNYLKQWEDNYDPSDYAISACATVSLMHYDLQSKKSIIMNNRSLEGWRRKNNTRVYYKFNNDNGNYKKSGLVEVISSNIVVPIKQEVKVVNMVKGPNNLMISEEEYDKLTDKGCQNCSCNLTREMAAEVEWMESKQPVCKDCYETIWMRDVIGGVQ